MATAKSIAKSVLKTVEEKLKLLSRVKGQRFETANVNPDDVRELARIKKELDEATANQQRIAEQYNEARQKVIKQLPGKDEDVVDITIAGVRIHKFPRNTAAGKLNEEKVLLLAKGKRLLNKIAPIKRIVDKKALVEAIAEEKITYEEYMACTTQNVVPVVDIEYTGEAYQPVMQIAK